MAFYLFHTHDPRGETVVLWENRYHNHIRKHEGITVAMIQTAVEEPEIITRDTTYPLRDNYYARGLDPDVPEDWVKVCVEFSSDEGKVITAFFTDRPKPEEDILWSR